MDNKIAYIIFSILFTLSFIVFWATIFADTMRIMQDKRENYKRSILAACVLVIMVILKKSFFE